MILPCSILNVNQSCLWTDPTVSECKSILFAMTLQVGPTVSECKSIMFVNCRLQMALVWDFVRSSLSYTDGSSLGSLQDRRHQLGGQLHHHWRLLQTPHDCIRVTMWRPLSRPVNISGSYLILESLPTSVWKKEWTRSTLLCFDVSYSVASLVTALCRSELAALASFVISYSMSVASLVTALCKPGFSALLCFVVSYPVCGASLVTPLCKLGCFGVSYSVASLATRCLLICGVYCLWSGMHVDVLIFCTWSIDPMKYDRGSLCSMDWVE